MNVTLFRKKVFANIIKDLRWDHPTLPRWAIYPMTSVLISNRGEDPDTEEDCEDGERMEGCRHDPRNTRSQAGRRKEGFSLNLWKKHSPANTLFQSSGPWNCERINSCAFRPPSLWPFVLAALGNYFRYSGPGCKLQGSLLKVWG